MRVIDDPHIVNAIQACGLALVVMAVFLWLTVLARPRRPKWPPPSKDEP